MTEAEWAASDDPGAMMTHLEAAANVGVWVDGVKVRPQISERKLRLFAVACCYGVSQDLGRDAEQIVEWNSDRASDPIGWAKGWAGDQTTPTQAQRAGLIRDIVGNPYRPVTLRRPQPYLVTNLAEAAYDDRDEVTGHLHPYRLAVLADALEETQPYAPHPLLAHLRSPRPHVRGCWAVDLVLGRE